MDKHSKSASKIAVEKDMAASRFNHLEKLTIEQELMIDELNIEIEKKDKALKEKKDLIEEKEKQIKELEDLNMTKSEIIETKAKQEKIFRDSIDSLKKTAESDKERFRKQVQFLEDDHLKLAKKYNNVRKSIFYKLYKIVNSK
jgi:septal ring factor EnvC (AmiA/AmiB activator)